MLYPDFVSAMDDVAENINYSVVDERNKNYRGKKTIDQQKKDYRDEMLRSEIRDALGEPPGFNCRTVDFEKLNENIDVFLEYITNCRKADGVLHRADSYTKDMVMCSQLQLLSTSRMT